MAVGGVAPDVGITWDEVLGDVIASLEVEPGAQSDSGDEREE
ncbi:hypothetical protein ACFHYQ_25765 [Sphaerimonospora cavernae]|uniref:Uncharacterized protein n=1 Tax=Sphaerimonospora cavernae TaxID=1740611 RepID=A0ABV6UBY4_9ACTN